MSPAEQLRIESVNDSATGSVIAGPIRIRCRTAPFNAMIGARADPEKPWAGWCTRAASR